MKDTFPSTRCLRRAVLGCVVVAATLCTLHAKPLRAEALETLLPYVIENHDRVRASKSRLTAARNRAREALGAWYPTLSQTANAGHETQENDQGDDTRTGFHEWDISLTQLLWDFGSTNAAIDKARLQVEAARYDVIETRQSLILEAITAYLNVVRSYRALQFAKDSEDNIRKQTGLEEALVGLGSGFSTDVLQAKTQLAGAQARRAQNEGALTNALNRYKAVFGRMPDDVEALEEVPFPAPFLPTTLTQATDIAFESNPSLKNAILDADIAVEDVRIARADNFTPKIDATAERKFKKNVGGTIGAEQETLAKVEMTFDFNLGFTAINTLRASESDLSATTFTAADTRRNIEEQVRNAWQQLDTAKQTASHLNNQANIAAAFLELARNERQLGRRSLIDVLSGETNLINSKSDALSAETDVLIAAYGLLAATGLLEYDVIKRSKGIKPPTSPLPETAPAAETPPSAPDAAPVQPVSPANGQQQGRIEPDVTVAGGRSLKEMQAFFKNIEAPDLSILDETVQTFGRSQSGGLVARPKHPPKPKSRYDSFADFDTHAGTFVQPEDTPAVEFASSNPEDATPKTRNALPAESDTGIGSTPPEIETAEPTTQETLHAQATADEPTSSETVSDDVSLPAQTDNQIAAVPDASAVPDTNDDSGFSLTKAFAFFKNAHQKLVVSRTRRTEVASNTVTMDMPQMPLPQPDTGIEIGKAPEPSEETASAGNAAVGPDPVSEFFGGVAEFFKRAQPDDSVAQEVAAVKEDMTAAPSIETIAESNPEPSQVAAIPAAVDIEAEQVAAPKKAISAKSNPLLDLFSFFEAAHQRALEDTARHEPKTASVTPAKELEPSAEAVPETTPDTAPKQVEPKKKPSLLNMISNFFGAEEIEYTPLDTSNFDAVDRH
ncbi:MAG: TolC family protein [Rhodospirillales bacterium]